ncbi:MAG: QueT transporter family protein [Clostridiales bacterium]|nr:QueT transporter family protein [Clostridiales bacterium]
MDRKWNVRTLTTGGIIAALYAALTLLLAPISFGAGGTIDFRVAEALTLLPILTPAAVPGLAVGCFAANLICGAPWQDVIFGTLATLLGAICTRKLRKNIWLAAAMPVVFNTVIVGTMLSMVYALPLWMMLFSVFVGEIAVCYLLGIPLIKLLQHTKLPLA